MALFSGLAVPEDSLLRILGDACACGIFCSEEELSCGMALFGGLAVPEDSLLRILRACACGIFQPEFVLIIGIALLGHLLKETLHK